MFTHRQIVFQVLLVDSSKWSQKVSRCRPQPFDCVDMNFSHSISIVISRPLFLCVTNRAVSSVDFVVALPFIRVTDGFLFCVPMHMLLQSLPICMLAHSQAALPTFSANCSDHWGPIIFIRPVTTPFVSPSSRRIIRIAVFFTFFPPHSETSRRSQFPGLSTPSDSTSHKRWLGFFFSSDARTGARVPVPQIRQLRARLCKHLAITRRLVVAQGYFLQIWFLYKGCRRSGTLGIGNQQSQACGCETLAPVELLHRSQNISVLLGESISQPTQCFLAHQANLLSGRSFPKFNMHKLVT